MNILRGDVARLQRCTAITTSSEEMISRWDHFVMQWLFVLCDENQGKNRTCCLYHLFPSSRCKPFKYTYEKEIVMYAYFKKLDYFSTECIYSPNAYRFWLWRCSSTRLALAMKSLGSKAEMIDSPSSLVTHIEALLLTGIHLQTYNDSSCRYTRPGLQAPLYCLQPA